MGHGTYTVYPTVSLRLHELVSGLVLVLVLQLVLALVSGLVLVLVLVLVSGYSVRAASNQQ